MREKKMLGGWIGERMSVRVREKEGKKCNRYWSEKWKKG